jgi:hypothetical protein
MAAASAPQRDRSEILDLSLFLFEVGPLQRSATPLPAGRNPIGVDDGILTAIDQTRPATADFRGLRAHKCSSQRCPTGLNPGLCAALLSGAWPNAVPKPLVPEKRRPARRVPRDPGSPPCCWLPHLAPGLGIYSKRINRFGPNRLQRQSKRRGLLSLPPNLPLRGRARPLP